MLINYSTLARENRKTALLGLKLNRGQHSALRSHVVYLKSDRRLSDVIFMSSRASAGFAGAALH